MNVVSSPVQNRFFLYLAISILVVSQVFISQNALSITCESSIAAKYERLEDLRKQGHPAYPGPVGEWAWNEFIKHSLKTRILHVGKKTFIASKDPEELATITEQLKTKIDHHKAVIFAEMTGWYFYPLSLRSLPRDLKKLLGFTAIYDNARCYSALCKALDYKSYVIDTGSTESEFILSSDLFEPIERSQLRQGDVIAIGPGNYPSNHVAYLVTDSLVFHKASPMAENHIELVPWSSFLSYYDDFSEGSKFFRPKMTFWQFVDRNRKKIPNKALDILGQLKRMGQDVEAYILTQDQDRYFDQDESFFQEFQNTVDQAKKQARIWVTYAEAELKKAEDQSDSVNQFIFQSIIYRAEAFFSLSGPYDD